MTIFSVGMPCQINQLEKDKDVVAQAQAIATLESLPQLPFSVVNALNNFLIDSKVLVTFRVILVAELCVSWSVNF